MSEVDIIESVVDVILNGAFLAVVVVFVAMLNR